ncbi:hypothetical protein NPIL_452081 [Nephila pilipes]|uniref:Uncharacterized protein n=1 Tax=Nephila pilipes TaxID=299642 RepID=A0A8X6UQU5_NEPPI|nr:hypothetical protein NPIL_452081 [Nephila pilipes]
MARGGVAGFYTPLRDQHNPHVFNEPSREELLLLEVLEHDSHYRELKLMHLGLFEELFFSCDLNHFVTCELSLFQGFFSVNQRHGSRKLLKSLQDITKALMLVSEYKNDEWRASPVRNGAMFVKKRRSDTSVPFFTRVPLSRKKKDVILA